MSQQIMAIDGQQVAAHHPEFAGLVTQYSAVVRETPKNEELLPPYVFEAEQRAWETLQRLTRFRWNQ